MKKIEEIARETDIEEVQKSINIRIRKELEQFFNKSILPCGLMFSHKLEEITFEMVLSSLQDLIGDESVVIHQVEVSKKTLYQKTSEGEFPGTFVRVWYFWD